MFQNNGSTVHILATKILVNNGTLENYGQLLIFGTLNNSSTINNIDRVLTQSGGILNNNSGGILNNPANAIVRNFGTGTLNNIGTWNNGGETNNMNGANGPINNNSGGIIINESTGKLRIKTGMTLTNSGTINNNSGGNIFNDGTLDNNSGGILNINGDLYNYENLNNSGTINNNSGGTISNDGTLDNNSGGILNINDFLYNYNNLNNLGTLKGTGTLFQYNIFTNSATASIAPGASPGTLTVEGDLDLGSGTYNCEINGTGQGTTYDWLAVSGAATLSGASLVVDWGGFTPTAGQTFTVMTFGSRTGTFSTVTIPPVAGLSFTTSHTNAAVTITAQAPLPAELVSFSASSENNFTQLLWRTASETNNEGFEIQRSTDGKNWNNLAFVPGHGTTTEEQSYAYTDERTLPGMNYYRLQQVDFDGKSEYSKVVSVEMKNGGGGIHFFPNPATGSVTLALETDYSGEATLTLYDLTGKQMKTVTLSLEGGAFRTDIGLGDLPTGIYMAQVQAGGVQWRERLIIK